MPPYVWRLRHWAFPHLAYPATLAPRRLFPYVSEAWGRETWLPWRMRPMSEPPVLQRAQLSVSLHSKMLESVRIPKTEFRWSRPCMDG
jgi:hypothetical protein